jgi:hypothetical protein
MSLTRRCCFCFRVFPYASTVLVDRRLGVVVQLILGNLSLRRQHHLSSVGHISHTLQLLYSILQCLVQFVLIGQLLCLDDFSVNLAGVVEHFSNISNNLSVFLQFQQLLLSLLLSESIRWVLLLLVLPHDEL